MIPEAGRIERTRLVPVPGTIPPATPAFARRRLVLDRPCGLLSRSRFRRRVSLRFISLARGFLGLRDRLRAPPCALATTVAAPSCSRQIISRSRTYSGHHLRPRRFERATSTSHHDPSPDRTVLARIAFESLDVPPSFFRLAEREFFRGNDSVKAAPERALCASP